MTTEKRPRKKSQKQLLVELLLDLKQDSRINWGAEMKVLGFILKKIPDLDFWFHFGQKSKYASLVHLLSDLNDTTLVLSEYYSYTKDINLKLKTSETPKMQQEKVGEDIIVTQKQKTLLDFINS